MMKGANQSRALNIASIQDLTGEFYVWEEPAYLKPVKGIRKVSLAPVVKGQSRFWTNSVEFAKALKTETGNVNENIARAIERQVDERERESDETDPWRDTHEVTVEAYTWQCCTACYFVFLAWADQCL